MEELLAVFGVAPAKFLHFLRVFGGKGGWKNVGFWDFPKKQNEQQNKQNKTWKKTKNNFKVCVLLMYVFVMFVFHMLVFGWLNFSLLVFDLFFG